MLEITGIKAIKKIFWQEIEPGMILLGGLRINGRIPDELQDFPVLTPALVEGIREQYRLLKSREIVVALCRPDCNPRQLSQTIRQHQGLLAKINLFRQEFFRQKQLLMPKAKLPAAPLLDSNLVNRQDLRLDVLNSLQLPADLPAAGRPLPSLLHNLPRELTTGDLLTNKINERFYLPEDQELLLHLVVEYSPAMQQAGSLEAALSGINLITRCLAPCLPGLRLKYYGFAEQCQPLVYPISGRELKAGPAAWAGFIKKVLHLKNRDLRNLVILLASGGIADEEETCKLARLLQVNRIDYIQILCPPAGSQPGASSLAASGCVAEISHGSQILLQDSRAAGVAAVECLDRYLGLLSLARQPEKQTVTAIRGQFLFQTETPQPQQKKVMHYQFPGGKVKKVVKYKDWYQAKKD